MYQGNWKCSQCGGAITELPFQPRSEAGLTCRSCFMKSRGGNAGGGEAAAPSSAPDEALGAAGDIDDREAPPFDPDEAAVASEAPPAPDFDGATAATPGEKPRIEGDWQCAVCGSPITSLPFTPRGTVNLKCIDCFKESKR